MLRLLIFKIIFILTMNRTAFTFAYALLSISGTTCCVYFFKEKLGMANGVVFSGAGLGMVVMPLAYSTGLEYFGLNGVLLVNAVTSFCVILLINKFYPSKDDIQQRISVKNCPTTM